MATAFRVAYHIFEPFSTVRFGFQTNNVQISRESDYGGSLTVGGVGY